MQLKFYLFVLSVFISFEMHGQNLFQPEIIDQFSELSEINVPFVAGYSPIKPYESEYDSLHFLYKYSNGWRMSSKTLYESDSVNRALYQLNFNDLDRYPDTPTSYQVNVYDSANNRVEYLYNYVTNTGLIDSNRHTFYSYNSSGLFETDSTYDYDSSRWDLKSTSRTYYDSNNLEIESISKYKGIPNSRYIITERGANYYKRSSFSYTWSNWEYRGYSYYKLTPGGYFNIFGINKYGDTTHTSKYFFQGSRLDSSYWISPITSTTSAVKRYYNSAGHLDSVHYYYSPQGSSLSKSQIIHYFTKPKLLSFRPQIEKIEKIIFPNPAGEFINVKRPQNAKNLRVFTLQGSEILNIKLENDMTSVATGKFKPGTYIYLIEGEKTFRGKIIKY